MQSNIKNTLLEARKAYRFLYEYQKRILDLASFIGGKFDMKYNGGFPKFSGAAPRAGKGYLYLWAWDWLNLYFYEFNFEARPEGQNSIQFAIFIVNDTGYFEANDENKIDKTSLEAFKSVEDSESKLILVVGKNMWDGWGANWDEPEFLLQPFGEKENANDGLMVFKHYQLENFETEEKALSCLKDFEKHCADRNVNFKMKINQFK